MTSSKSPNFLTLKVSQGVIKNGSLPYIVCNRNQAGYHHGKIPRTRLFAKHLESLSTKQTPRESIPNPIRLLLRPPLSNNCNSFFHTSGLPLMWGKDFGLADSLFYKAIRYVAKQNKIKTPPTNVAELKIIAWFLRCGPCSVAG